MKVVWDWTWAGFRGYIYLGAALSFGWHGAIEITRLLAAAIVWGVMTYG